MGKLKTLPNQKTSNREHKQSRTNATINTKQNTQIVVKEDIKNKTTTSGKKYNTYTKQKKEYGDVRNRAAK